MNIQVMARSRQVGKITDAIREYLASKMAKLPHYYDNVQSAEVILDMEAEKPVVEIVVTAKRKTTFVATHRGEDMYESIDQCLHKIVEQIRRHKDKVRDRQGIPHDEALEQTAQ